MRVIEVLDKKGHEIIQVSPECNLHQAAQSMTRAGTGALLVFDGEGEAVGIVTERDLLRALGDHGSKAAELTVAEVMAARLVTCSGDTEIQEAMALMLENPTSQRIRHLPVVDGDGKVCGMVSMSDLADAMLEEMRFENSMLKNFIKNWDDEEVAGEGP